MDRNSAAPFSEVSPEHSSRISGEICRIRNGYYGNRIPLPEAIYHARKIVDYLWRSNWADSEFWAGLPTNQPHIYNSVVVLERWTDEQPTVLKVPQWFRFDHPIMSAFAGGFLFAVLFFLPEILR